MASVSLGNSNPTASEQRKSPSSPSADSKTRATQANSSKDPIADIVKGTLFEEVLKTAQGFLHKCTEADSKKTYTLKLLNVPEDIGKSSGKEILATVTATLTEASQDKLLHSLIIKRADYNERNHTFTVSFTVEQAWKQGDPFGMFVAVKTKDKVSEFPLVLNGGPFVTITYTTKCSKQMSNMYVQDLRTMANGRYDVMGPHYWSPTPFQDSKLTLVSKFLVRLHLRDWEADSSKRGTKIPKEILFRDLVTRTDQHGQIRISSPQHTSCERCGLSTHATSLCGFEEDDLECIKQVVQVTKQMMQEQRQRQKENKKNTDATSREVTLTTRPQQDNKETSEMQKDDAKTTAAESKPATQSSEPGRKKLKRWQKVQRSGETETMLKNAHGSKATRDEDDKTQRSESSSKREDESVSLSSSPPSFSEEPTEPNDQIPSMPQDSDIVQASGAEDGSEPEESIDTSSAGEQSASSSQLHQSNCQLETEETVPKPNLAVETSNEPLELEAALDTLSPPHYYHSDDQDLEDDEEREKCQRYAHKDMKELSARDRTSRNGQLAPTRASQPVTNTSQSSRTQEESMGEAASSGEMRQREPKTKPNDNSISHNKTADTSRNSIYTKQGNMSFSDAVQSQRGAEKTTSQVSQHTSPRRPVAPSSPNSPFKPNSNGNHQKQQYNKSNSTARKDEAKSPHAHKRRNSSIYHSSNGPKKVEVGKETVVERRRSGAKGSGRGTLPNASTGK